MGLMSNFTPIRINGRTFESPLDLTEGYRRGEVSLVQAAAGLSKWGWAPPRIAQALTHPSGNRGRRAVARAEPGDGIGVATAPDDTATTWARRARV